MLSACTLGKQPGTDEAPCGGRDAAIEAFFQYQFDNNASALGENAAAWFIGLEGGRDPSPGLLERFERHEPAVRPLSGSALRDGQVVDAESGEPALAFRVVNIVFPDRTTAAADGGYSEGPVSASFERLSARCGPGGWIVQRAGPLRIS